MKCWLKILVIPEQSVFLFDFDDNKIKILSPVLTHYCHPASRLLQPRTEAELLITTRKAVF